MLPETYIKHTLLSLVKYVTHTSFKHNNHTIRKPTGLLDTYCSLLTLTNGSYVTVALSSTSLVELVCCSIDFFVFYFFLL